MIKIIGGSGFVGTRLSKSSSEFSIIDKAMSKTFKNICSIADVRDTQSMMYPTYQTQDLQFKFQPHA